MNEKEKYLNLYNGRHTDTGRDASPHGRMGGGYGRICWGENLLETLKAWQVNSLMDVGCGYGNFCDAATLFVPRVYGLDIASVATGNIVDNPDITFFDGEAKHLPLPDKGVEWITSFDCLEHCLEEDIDDILREFDRVAIKGFALSISYVRCECDGMPLHMTVKPEAWWIDKLSRFGAVSKVGRAPITGVPYLICRKPVVKKLICYCAGTLGQRLRSLAAAVEFSGRSERRLIMVWQKHDPQCQAGFRDLFTNPVTEISEEAFLELTSCKVYALIKDVASQALVSGGTAMRKAVRRWGAADPESASVNDEQDHLIIFQPRNEMALKSDAGRRFIAELDPVAEVRNQIDELIGHLDIHKSIMGVHARGTDFGVKADAYAHQMRKALHTNPDQKFLVCSEDRSNEEQLCRQFPRNAVGRSKTDWHQKIDSQQPWSMGNVTASKTSVIETLIDIYLLAGTQFEIYHESSAMAELGVVLAKTGSPQLNTESGPQRSGTGIQLHGRRPTAGQPPEISAPVNQMEPCCQVTESKRAQCRIYYFCPDAVSQSARIRRLFRHVSLLNAAGFSASILHEKSGFRQPDMPQVPLAYLDRIGADENAIFVIPEGMPRIMRQLKSHPGRKWVIALNWHYIFSTLTDGMDWRHFNIERVLAVSPVVGRLVAWSMDLPMHLIQSAVDHQLYYHDPELKVPQVAFIARKAHNIEKLKRLLASRNINYINKIKWVSLDGLPQDEYAAQIRKSSLFLSTSMAEGHPTSCLEAMAAGTLVAGYDSVGGRMMLCGQDTGQNCILAPNGDYLSLAYALSPVLNDLLGHRMTRWQKVIETAKGLAMEHTTENEQRSLIAFWREFVHSAHDRQPTLDHGLDLDPVQPDAA